MGRRESIAAPSVTGRAAAELTAREFATVQVRFHSLIQEARVLREEAMSLHAAPYGYGNQVHRRGLLYTQALLCSTEAIELVREACRRRARRQRR